MTTVPTTSSLEPFLGKHIREICGNGYADENDNHCAHFAAHVIGFGFGATCLTMSRGNVPGASIRVHEVFARCPAVGAWGSRTASSCLVFVTDQANVSLARKQMSNVPKKHMGIYLDGMVWHYSNAQSKVVTQFPTEFAHHYPGPGIALFWGTFPR